METVMTANYKRSPLSIVEIMQFMTHNGYKKKGSRQPFNKVAAYEKSMSEAPYHTGVVFVSRQKQTLPREKDMS